MIGGSRLSAPVAAVADAFEGSGLGHLARAGAVAAALEERGVAVTRVALGASAPVALDGARWAPADAPPDAELVVLDSYRVAGAARRRLAARARLVEWLDHGEPTPGAALSVDVAGAPPAPAAASLDLAGAGAAPAPAAAPPLDVASPNASSPPRRLVGLAYACLRPPFWALPASDVRAAVERILVTTGGGDPGGRAAAIAAAARAGAPPGARVGLVRGPQAAPVAAGAGFTTLPPRASLLGDLLRADLVVSAAGQTMFEAAAAGAPCVAVVLADNQARQAACLAAAGAVRTAAPADVRAAVRELAADTAARRDLAKRGRALVDGQGARRVAAEIARQLGT